MDDDISNNGGRGSSRRRLLAAVGATSATVAGCLDLLSEGESDGGSSENGSKTDSHSGAEQEGDDVLRWPAVEGGELLSDFSGQLHRRTGEVSAAPDEARIGSQAALVEADSGEAGLSVYFSDGIDLEDWGVSVAVKPEQASRIVVEFIAPHRSQRLTTVRTIPDEYTGWFRLDCGYEHKPADEPDLSEVTAINIIAANGDNPVKMFVDDLRRTQSADNGKAILAFYGGRDSHYDIAAEMLAERDWAGAVPVDPEAIGGSGRMGTSELQELQSRGWDICSYPSPNVALPEQPADRQRRFLENAREQLESEGFEKGPRHLFVPDERMDETTHEVIRDVHDSAYIYGGSCPSIVPPTGQHMISVDWGPALYNGVRRHINLAMQYQVLTAFRIPRIVDEDVDGGNRMSLDDFEHLLDHIEQQGLDVITPSELIDEEW